MTAPVATERVPLFPLPNVVFFPGTYLNLMIFEERYLDMMRDILDGSGRIAVTLATGVGGHSSNDSVALGEVRPVVTIGSIRHYEPIPDRRYEVTLYGETRARIRAQRFDHAYREVIVEPCPEDRGGDVADIERARGELLSRYDELLARTARSTTEAESANRLVDADVTFETLVNAVPSLLNLPAGERQRLLEIDSLLHRCAETTRHLDDALRAPLDDDIAEEGEDGG